MVIDKLHTVLQMKWLVLSTVNNNKNLEIYHLQTPLQQEFYIPTVTPFFFPSWQSLPLLHKLKCSGVISAHCKLCLLGSSDPPTSALGEAGITGMHHHTQLNIVFSVEMGLYHVGQASLELLASSDPPISTSQSAVITGVSHHTQPHDGISLLHLHVVEGDKKE